MQGLLEWIGSGCTMKIIDNEIHFESYPLNYNKERGLNKCNTVRTIDAADVELLQLHIVEGEDSGLLYCGPTKIKTIHVHCGAYIFNRVLSDVSFFDGRWIFSWRGN
jgi:hypothetical protein